MRSGTSLHSICTHEMLMVKFDQRSNYYFCYNSVSTIPLRRNGYGVAPGIPLSRGYPDMGGGGGGTK